MKNRYSIITLCIFALLFSSCDVTRYVPDGKYLLNKVQVKTDTKSVQKAELYTYVRQKPNTKLFNAINFNLGMYSVASEDTTQWINRFLKEQGEAPIILDTITTKETAEELRKTMQNKGYPDAKVETTISLQKKKASVVYEVKSGKPYTINNIIYKINNDSLEHLVLKDTAKAIIKKNQVFNIDNLEKERVRIAKMLKNNGYLYFGKEYINFVADSTVGNRKIDLKLKIKPINLIVGKNEFKKIEHAPYYIRNVNYYTADKPINLAKDSVDKYFTKEKYKDINIYSNTDFVRNRVLFNNTHIDTMQLYRETDIEQTYAKLSSLRIFRYLNISFSDVADSVTITSDTTYLSNDSILIKNDTITLKRVDCNIAVTADKSQGFAFELEGTNNEGDFGIAGKFSYNHNNLFKGGEVFKFNIRGANESLITKDRSIWEISTEASLAFPQFVFPGLKKKFIRNNQANTEVYINYSYQIRSEYSRMIAGAGMRYNWNSKKQIQHRVELVDFNYVYLPYISPEFEDDIEQSLLKYSYEDHLIMRAGYGISYSNQHLRKNRSAYTVGASFEIGGNLLYGICAAANAPKDETGSYLIGNTPFAQYAKIDAAFSYKQRINAKNFIVYNIAAGIGIPYANSYILPFEKRYYGGGANSVRGWSARSLGPGNYSATTNIDYMKQSGDISFNMNVEYRTNLIWKLELAAFLDAGNIWTLADEGQAQGQFRGDTFYKQIAFGYGIGLRLNFDFFILRLDWGIKAFDPSKANGERWRFTNTWDITKDTALHFAVGYPF